MSHLRHSLLSSFACLVIRDHGKNRNDEDDAKKEEQQCGIGGLVSLLRMLLTQMCLKPGQYLMDFGDYYYDDAKNPYYKNAK